MTILTPDTPLMPEPAEHHEEWAERLYLRHPALMAERHQLDHTTLMAFACFASVLLLRGRAYLLGTCQNREPLELARDLGRPVQTLRRMADLADAYGDIESEELENVAFLAMARGVVRPQVFSACVESEARLLRTLAPTGAFAGCLLEWRRLKAAGDLPPPEFVAYCLAGDWDQVIYKHNWPDIACHLAAAFTDGQLTVEQVEELVAAHGMQVLTPELARELAEEAIEQACARRLSASSESVSPDEHA